MELSGKSAETVTPIRDPQSNRSKISELSKYLENSNPNVTSPSLKPSNSPALKSAKKPQNSVSKNPNTAVTSPSPRNKIRERKFVVAKKKSKKEKINTAAVACKCKVGGKSHKCLCVAYESLRASQEEFFKNRGGDSEFQEGEEKNLRVQNPEIENGYGRQLEEEEDNCYVTDGLDKYDVDEVELCDEMGKRRRNKLLEEARDSVPEPGSGRVKHLVKAFEKLLTLPKSEDSDEKEDKEPEDTKKGIKWALPGLQPPKVAETQVSSPSFCPSDFFLTSESLGLERSSLDSSQGSISSRTSGGGRRSRRNSSGSSGSFTRKYWKRRQHKATCQKPFKLRTEQRGRCKEEEFIKKVQQMMEEEERQRIPIAQGLPWTTDEPECLIKPPVRDSTRPIDLVLHSDVRAAERAEFDHQVSEKLNLIEQYRMERERQRKLEEEEEIRRLRKELVPKAQPMPYFDRPFVPRRSLKHPTIPKEPKFNIPQHKKIKCCLSWNDLYIQQQ